MKSSPVPRPSQPEVEQLLSVVNCDAVLLGSGVNRYTGCYT